MALARIAEEISEPGDNCTPGFRCYGTADVVGLQPCNSTVPNAIPIDFWENGSLTAKSRCESCGKPLGSSDEEVHLALYRHRRRNIARRCLDGLRAEPDARRHAHPSRGQSSAPDNYPAGGLFIAQRSAVVRGRTLRRTLAHTRWPHQRSARLQQR